MWGVLSSSVLEGKESANAIQSQVLQSANIAYAYMKELVFDVADQEPCALGEGTVGPIWRHLAGGCSQPTPLHSRYGSC